MDAHVGGVVSGGNRTKEGKARADGSRETGTVRRAAAEGGSSGFFKKKHGRQQQRPQGRE